MTRSRSVVYVAKVGILAALYFAAGKLGLFLAIAQGNVTPVWPPAGIALAAMLSTTVSATIGVVGLCLGGVASWADYGALCWESANV
jgi:integral membrane sensor domain MASE1